MLAAGDTFRAGAIDQLEVWGERAGAEVIKQAEGRRPGRRSPLMLFGQPSPGVLMFSWLIQREDYIIK